MNEKKKGKKCRKRKEKTFRKMVIETI